MSRSASPRPSAAVAGLAPYALADLGPPGAVSLAQNEACCPPSPAALAAAAEALAEARLYPDPDWHALRAAIAAVHGVAEGQILCGAGSMELLAATARAYLGPGDRALMPAHAYPWFSTAVAWAGAEVDRAPERDLTVDVAALLAAVSPRTRLVFVANPANPTGTHIDPEALARLRAGLPEDVLLIVDEAYGEFAPGPGAFGLVAGGATVVLRSFSKAYGLAGLRAGWGLFPPAVAAQVRKALPPNSLSAPSAAAAAAAMRDQAWMRAGVTETARRRDAFALRMRAAGLPVPASAANFVLVGFDSPARAAAAEGRLRAEGLILRPAGSAGLPHCLRATVGPEDAMARAAAVIEAAR